MEVIEMIEHEDGSATLRIDMTNEEKNFFINYAFVDILKKQLDLFELEFNNGREM